MQAILLSVAMLASPPQIGGLVGTCNPDPADGPRPTWSAEDRRETRDRVAYACRELGAAPHVCAYYDAVTVRESSGEAGVRHLLGRDADGRGEYGLGAMGLSLRWHADKWPGDDEDPMFCLPEVSAVVTHAIVWGAVTRFHAATILEVQAIFAGQFSCYPGQGCYATPTPRTAKSICGRMEQRGYSCNDRVTPADLGKRVPLRDRRAWVEGLLRKIGALAEDESTVG